MIATRLGVSVVGIAIPEPLRTVAGFAGIAALILLAVNAGEVYRTSAGDDTKAQPVVAPQTDFASPDPNDPCGNDSPGRNAAFRAAKDKGGIPRTQQPDMIEHVRLRHVDDFILARLYHFTRPDGVIVRIAEHSIGHPPGHGPSKPHFNTYIDNQTLRDAHGNQLDSHTFFCQD